jgi:biotin transport system substrate-specific component
MFAAMLLGSAVIFGCGLAWLSRFLPAPALFASGLAPFIPGDIVKTTLAALAFPALWRRTHDAGSADSRG